jgi:hypothetical protein
MNTIQIVELLESFSSLYLFLSLEGDRISSPNFIFNLKKNYFVRARSYLC